MSSAIDISSAQTKVSKNTFHGIIQQYGAFGNLKTSKESRKGLTFFEKLRPSQRHLIRVIIHNEFKKCNERKKRGDTADGTGLLFPTVKLLYKVIQEQYSEELPNMTERRLYHCMRMLGFRYKRHPDTKNVLLIGTYFLNIDFVLHCET